MKKRIPFIILAVFVTLFIFSNSFETAEVSGQSSKKIVEAVAKAISTTLKKSPDTNLITYCVRKTAHIMEFALQGFCLSGCFAFAYRHRKVLTLSLGLLTACIDETIQFFVPGRASMIQDVIIDFSGTAIGLFAFGLLHYIYRKIKEKV